MNELDKAIEVLQGNYDNAAAVCNGVGNWLWKTNGLKGYQGVSDSSKGWFGEYICTRAEFEARAEELGWVNGYKWGKEYPVVNGEKPKLPDDAVVEWTASDGYSNTTICGNLNWKGCGFNRVVKLKIIDEQYKPVEPANQSTDWHERGELPPAGVEFLFSRNGTTWEERLMLFNDGITCLMAHKKYPENRFHYKCNDDSVQFRPIKTDRERFIDAVNAVLGPEKLIAIQLFDAGFKAPNNID